MVICGLICHCDIVYYICPALYMCGCDVIRCVCVCARVCVRLSVCVCVRAERLSE